MTDGALADSSGSATIDVVTVSYNGSGHLEKALRSFVASKGVEVRNIVVDNASTDDSVAVASCLGAQLIVLDTNVGYGAALNHGIAMATAEWVVCANQDVQVRPDSIARLLSAATEHADKCGKPCVAGPRLVTPTGETAETCHKVPTLAQQTKAMLFGESAGGVRNAYPETMTTRHCGWVSAAFILGQRELFRELRGFDPAYFMYVEDLDFFTRLAAAGGHCLWVPGAEVVHARGGGRVQSSALHAHALWNWKRYFTEHGGRRRRLAGQAILAAGIAGSLGRGAIWWVRSLGGNRVAADHARMFGMGGLIALAGIPLGRPPAPKVPRSAARR